MALTDWKKPKKDRMCRSLPELARYTGWPLSTLESWGAAGKFKRDKSGRVSTKDVWEVVEEKLAHKGDEPEAMPWKERKDRADALKKETELQIMNAELVNLEEARTILLRAAHRLRQQLQNVGNQVAPLFDANMAPRIKEEIDRQISQSLSELSTEVTQSLSKQNFMKLSNLPEGSQLQSGQSNDE